MRWSRMSALVLGVAFSGALQAQFGDRLLKGTPLSAFTDEDISLFEAAQSEALEERRDGSVVSWENPDTGASGTVTPLQTDRRGDGECRLLRIVNRADNRQGESQFWFCRQPDGQWKIAPTEQPR